MANQALTTIPQLLATTVARAGDQPALGSIRDGQLSWQTWEEVDVEVRRFAATLKQANVGPGDRVAQLATNSAEWIVTDLAVLSLGAVHMPLHASLSVQQLAELFELGNPKVLVTADTNISLAAEILSHEVLANFSATPPIEADVKPSQLATLLFTSGTTGQPRGVMLSHENLVSNTIATTEAVGSAANETRLCFLPLSHIYARTCDLYTWLYRGSRLVLAESRETIVRDCQLIRPSVVNGVPYFYQKLAQQLQDAEPGTLRQLLGGNLKHCFGGGAAVAPEVAALFQRQGLPILMGYGLTEASPVVSATANDDYRPGTVGRPLENLEVRLSKSGVILVRGPSVMLGYWNDPAQTAASIVDGWLHTGDLGEFDEAGHLRIVGRQKELIVLSTGKNVAPSRVEQLLSGSPLVEHVCVVGEGRKCLGALLVPNPEALRREIRSRRLWVWSRHRAVTHPRVRELFRREIDRLLAEASAEQQVGFFTILPRNFSIEQGELTSKLSLRRQTIATNFGREIEQMFAD